MVQLPITQVLIASNYTDAALRLAKSRGMHERCVRLLVEHKHDFEGAVKYLSALPDDEVRAHPSM